MDFMVEFEIGIPPDYDADLLADLLRRERERAAEISARGDFFKMVWTVPCQRARIGICTAASAEELQDTFASLPGMRWNNYETTPLIPCAPGSAICLHN